MVLKSAKQRLNCFLIKPYEIIFRMPNPCFEGTRKNDLLSLFSVNQNVFLWENIAEMTFGKDIF